MFNFKKIVVVILICLLIFGIGFFVFKLIKKEPVLNNVIKQEEVEQARANEELRQMNTALDQIILTDKDLDGLTDEEETKLGTNPNSPDTDGDGIMDKDEIDLWKTNPLKADTDGDGKLDGEEARRGTDPLKK